MPAFVRQVLIFGLLMLSATVGFAQRSVGVGTPGSQSFTFTGVPTNADSIVVRVDNAFPGDPFASGTTFTIPLGPLRQAKASPAAATFNFTYRFNLGNVVGSRNFSYCYTIIATPACLPNGSLTWRHAVYDPAFLNCSVAPSALTTIINTPSAFQLSCPAETAALLGPDVRIGTRKFDWSYPGRALEPTSVPSWNFTPTFAVTNAPVSVSYAFPVEVFDGTTFVRVGTTGVFNRTASLTVTPNATATTRLSVNPSQTTYEVNVPVTLAAAVVSPAAAVAQVQFLEVDAAGIERVISVATTAPFEVRWTPNRTGSIQLRARTFLVGQSVGFSATPINVTVVDPPNPPPQVSITSPRDNARFGPGTAVTLSANATDADGIASVQFFGTLNGTGSPGPIGPVITASPYEYTVQAGSNSGDYVVFARAIDRLNASTDSASIRFTLGVTASVVDTSTAEQRRFVPGSDVRLSVRASESLSGTVRPVANRALRWTIETPASACAGADTPANGTTTTDTAGNAGIQFRAGCNSANKTVLVAFDDQPQTILARIVLSGPDQAITTLQPPSATGNTVIATPGVPEPMRIEIPGANPALVQGALVNWSISSNLGTVQPPQSVINNAAATSNVILLAGVNSATVNACIVSTNVCTQIFVRSVQQELNSNVPTVTAPILQAAVDAPRAQVSLISNRLARLRNESGHGFSNEVQVNIAGIAVPTSAGADASIAGGESSTSSGSAGAEGKDVDEDDEADAKRQASKLGVFMLGDVSVVKSKAGSGAPADDGSYKVKSRGVTLGVDYRFHKDFVAGIALGGTLGNSDSGSAQAGLGIARNGVTQDNRGYSVSLFAQYLASEHGYLSGVFNVGRNSYDIERFATRGTSEVTLRSDGKSNQSALMLETGYSFAKGTTRLTPFARYEYIRAKMGSIRETGGASALFIDSYDSKLSTFSAGLSADMAINTRSGVVLPGFKLEFFKENADTDPVRARLVSNVSGFLPIAPNVEIDNMYGNAGLSLQWLTGYKGQPINGFLGFDYQFARDNFSARTLSIGIKIPL